MTPGGAKRLVGCGHRARARGPWAHGVSLTFQSARTSSARSRSPPRVLPRMIQMGICDSSGLEISNVICEEKNHPNINIVLLGVRVEWAETEGMGGQCDEVDAACPHLWEDAREGAYPTHAILLRFSLLSPLMLGLELPGSGHSCTELLWALQVAPAAGFFPLGSEWGVAASPNLLGPHVTIPSGAHLAAGVFLAEDEGAPEASLESGVRGELQ